MVDVRTDDCDETACVEAVASLEMEAEPLTASADGDSIGSIGGSADCFSFARVATSGSIAVNVDDG